MLVTLYTMPQLSQFCARFTLESVYAIPYSSVLCVNNLNENHFRNNHSSGQLEKLMNRKKFNLPFVLYSS